MIRPSVIVRRRRLGSGEHTPFVGRVAKALARMSSPVALDRLRGERTWIEISGDDPDVLRGSADVVTTSSATVAAILADRHPVVCLYGAESSTHPSVVYLGGLEGSSAVECDADVRFAKILTRLVTVPDFRPVTPVGWPMRAMVEVVRACNLRCPLCPVGNGEAEHYTHMSTRLFQKIAGALAPTVSVISLYNYGEPLLHPEIATLVRIAHEAGIEQVEITTNGTILSPGVEDELVAAGLDAMRVSIDGATQESYERYRVGGELAKIWRHIDRVLAARERHGSRTPVIEAQFVVNRHNEHELEAFRALCAEHGVDRVRFKTFNALMTGPKYAEAGRAFLPASSQLLRYTDRETLTVRDRYKLSQCSWPWQRIVVNADGAIVPCCYDFNGRHRLGSFATDGEWWQTQPRRAFRERLQTDPMSIDICSVCPVGVPNLSVEFD